MIPFTAVVLHYYDSRKKYLKRILETLQRAEPQEIILWDNSGQNWDAGSLPGATVITSERNTIMYGLYMAALLAKTDIVYTQGDDLVMQPEDVKKLVIAAKLYKGSICGPCGVNVDISAPEPYNTRRPVLKGPCDIMVGRVTAFHKSAIMPGLAWSIETGTDLGRCDDIIMSMVGRGQAVRVPFESLDEEGIGLSHEPDHFPERNAMVRRLARVHA